MYFLNWYDWITPTNPYAALLLGFIFTSLLSLAIWFENRSWKIFFISLTAGLVITFIGVALLYSIGWYN